MAEAFLAYAAWTTLRLTSSLISSGWKMLTADAEQSVNCSLVHWGGDVVYTAQQKQQQRQLQQRQRRYNRGAGGATSGDGDALDDGAYSDEASADGAMVMASSGGLLVEKNYPQQRLHERLALQTQESFSTLTNEMRRSMEQVRLEVSVVNDRVMAAQEDNQAFFRSFSDSIDQTRRILEAQQQAPLKSAKQDLNNFQACGGDVLFLERSHQHAEDALAQAHTLNVALSAGLIAIATGYVWRAKVKSPEDAKTFVARGTLRNIVDADVLAASWMDVTQANTLGGQKVLLYLMDVVSCVNVFPPDSVDVIPMLNPRLRRALGLFCASQPQETMQYSDTRRSLVEHVLLARSLPELCGMAEAAAVDVAGCDNRADMVKALADCGKALQVGGQSSSRSSPKRVTRDVGVQTEGGERGEEGGGGADVSVKAGDSVLIARPPESSGSPAHKGVLGKYRVVRKDQLRVHSMENIKDPNCEQVGFVCPGTDLVVVEVRGSRVRIVAPIRGWCSVADDMFGEVFAEVV